MKYAWLLLFLIACTASEQPPKEQLQSNTIEKPKQTPSFPPYLLPSPLQIRILFNSLETFHNDWLLPTDVVASLNQNTHYALALGMYSADLAYALHFKQTQKSVKLLKTLEELCHQLHLEGVFTQKLLDRIDKNKENTDSLTKIATKVYSQVQERLQQSGMSYLKDFILFGGWIESLYIGTKGWQETKNKVLKEKIAEQKLYLKVIRKRLEQNPEGTKLVTLYLNKLDEAFSPIEVRYSGKAQIKKIGNLIVVENKNTFHIPEGAMQTIAEVITDVRENLLKQSL